MPSGPIELHEKWKSDENAISFLLSEGFILTRRWEWVPPIDEQSITDEQRSAIKYLIYEWDFGGITKLEL